MEKILKVVLFVVAVVIGVRLALWVFGLFFSIAIKLGMLALVAGGVYLVYRKLTGGSSRAISGYRRTLP